MCMYTHRRLRFALISLFSDDWNKFTDYRGYEKDDEVIKWFWTILRGWPAEKKLRLLQFTTGTSRIPVAGFRVCTLDCSSPHVAVELTPF